MAEAILEPDLPIVDPHHHLWDRRSYADALPPPEHPFMTAIADAQRYLLDELLADTGSGHNVARHGLRGVRRHVPRRRAGGAAAGRRDRVRQRRRGDERQRHLWRDPRLRRHRRPRRTCCWATRSKPVLEAHIAAGGGRFRGIRNSRLLRRRQGGAGAAQPAWRPGSICDATFREGFAHLAPHGPVLRRLAAGAAAARPDRPGPRLPRHDHRARPRGHAARASGSYAGKLRGAVRRSGATTSASSPSRRTWW